MTTFLYTSEGCYEKLVDDLANININETYALLRGSHFYSRAPTAPAQTPEGECPPGWGGPLRKSRLVGPEFSLLSPQLTIEDYSLFS